VPPSFHKWTALTASLHLCPRRKTIRIGSILESKGFSQTKNDGNSGEFGAHRRNIGAWERAMIPYMTLASPDDRWHPAIRRPKAQWRMDEIQRLFTSLS